VIEALRECFKILESRAKRKFVFLSLGQVLLSFLDLVGILMVGAIGALGIRGVNGAEAGDRVGQLLSFMQIEVFSLTEQIAVLGSIATVLLTSKTLFSALITRRTYDFLSRNSAELTTTLMREISQQTRDKRNLRNSQELLYALNDGVRIIIVSMLGAATLLLADLSLIITLCFGLALLDLQIALISISYFFLVGIMIYVLLQKRILRLGRRMTTEQIQTNQEILELLTASREISVSGKADFYINRIGDAQRRFLQTVSDFTFIPLLGKYIIEGSLVFGALLLGYLQFHLQDPYRAVASVSVFIAAGTRMAPALLRLQNSALLIKGSKGSTASTFNLIKEINCSLRNAKPTFKVFEGERSFNPEVEFINVGFKYDGDRDQVVNEFNLHVESGTSIAIVGTSGSGKSTLLDLMLGILAPESGRVLLSGADPREAISKWPGLIGYVPQQVGLFNRSLAENIAIGVETSDIDLVKINNCLVQADLETVISDLEIGLDTILQESGNNLSGGQKQRIGIARALYTNPKLLILDEATSALDVQSESKIISNIVKGSPDRTIILVTHRISVAKSADLIIYLEKGQIRAIGSFDQIKKKVPDFEAQASLSGL
jgi:ATP-binding cassette subfamily C protein